MTAPVDYRRRGQAVWLDTISSKLIRTGRLSSWIDSGSIYGVTSNPTIFGQSIQKNEGDYNAVIEKRAREGADAFTIYDEITRRDIAEGADLFKPLHDRSPVDGWISLEVLPSLAEDTEKTVAEAQRLIGLLKRPNVFIKVPATPAGVPAIRRLIGAGVSINVTLMFNRKHYRDVAAACIGGLSDFAAKGGDLSRVHSVASFFVSRVDTLIDKSLDDLISGVSRSPRAPRTETEKAHISSLKGKAGLANSKVVYQDFLESFGNEPFTSLNAKGARVQRPLWASTGTKNPAYSDLLYVENLIGPDTVNTMPEKTLDALLDHGKCPGDTVKEGLGEARKTLDDLRSFGVDTEAVGEQLQKDGVALFTKSYQELMATIESRRAEATNTARAEVKV
jgi:transaldolase